MPRCARSRLPRVDNSAENGRPSLKVVPRETLGQYETWAEFQFWTRARRTSGREDADVSGADVDLAADVEIHGGETLLRELGGE